MMGKGCWAMGEVLGDRRGVLGDGGRGVLCDDGWWVTGDAMMGDVMGDVMGGGLCMIDYE